MADGRTTSLTSVNTLQDATDLDEVDGPFLAITRRSSRASWSRPLSVSSARSNAGTPSPGMAKRPSRSTVHGGPVSPASNLAPLSPTAAVRFTRGTSVSAASGSLPDLPGAIEEGVAGEGSRRPKRLAPLSAKAEVARHLARASIATSSLSTSPRSSSAPRASDRFATTDNLERTGDGLRLIGKQPFGHEVLLSRGGSFEPLPPIQRSSHDFSSTSAGKPSALGLGTINRADEATEVEVFSPRTDKPSIKVPFVGQVEEQEKLARSSPTLSTPPCERESPDGQECDEPSRMQWPVNAQTSDRDSCSNRLLPTSLVINQQRGAAWRASVAATCFLRPIRAGDVRLSAVSHPFAAAKIKKRRQKSFPNDVVDGPISPAGEEEEVDDLDWYLPSRRLEVFIGTWNMHGGKVPDSVTDFLLPQSIDLMQDIYVVCTQESTSSRHSWEVKLQETLGPSHILLHSASLGVVYVIIFVRRELLWFVTEIEDKSFATRAVNMVKTKGGVAVSMKVFGTSLLFITSHLTAHERNLAERNMDVSRITAGLHLSDGQEEVSDKAPPLTDRFDCVVWCGDLNYRVNVSYKKAMAKILVNKHLELLEQDQLRQAMAEGGVFAGFEEMEIRFPPTFKFDVGTDDYDTSAKQRTPSWTDRVLYCSRPTTTINGAAYDSCGTICYSDHKPVYAILDITIKPSDFCPVQLSQSIGSFKRDVYLEGNQRRMATINRFSQSVCTSNQPSTVCTLL